MVWPLSPCNWPIFTKKYTLNGFPNRASWLLEIKMFLFHPPFIFYLFCTAPILPLRVEAQIASPTHTHARTHAHTRTHIHTHTHTHIHARARGRAQTHTHKYSNAAVFHVDRFWPVQSEGYFSGSSSRHFCVKNGLLTRRHRSNLCQNNNLIFFNYSTSF